MHVNGDLARIISRQAIAIRNWLAKEGFVEIFPPHLTRVKKRPFVPTFEVSSPELNFEGALRVSANYFLAETVSQVSRAYSITPTFRAEQDTRPSALTEFQLGEVWREGNFDDLLTFSENLLSNARSALLDESSPVSLAQARLLEKINFPLPRVTYEEAIKRVGGEFGETFTPHQELALMRTFGSTPIFITHFPPEFDTCFSDMRQDSNKRMLGFELRSPLGGELMSGGELETDRQTLLDQFQHSRFLKELIKLGGSEEQLVPYVNAISRLVTPHFRMAFGFERLTQFLLRAKRIEDASLFPVRVRTQEQAARDGIIIVVVGGGTIIIIDSIVVVVPDDPEPV